MRRGGGGGLGERARRGLEDTGTMTISENCCTLIWTAEVD